MDDKMCQCGHYESDHGADGSCGSYASTGYCPCFIFDDSDAQPDPRDAEIARLKAEVERFKRALAAGPAALRAKYAGYKGGIVKGAYDQSADLVERAQAEAMKEKP